MRTARHVPFVLTIILAAVLAGSLQAAATDAVAGPAVVQAWARATPPGIAVGGAYFTILNSGPADELLAVESPVSPHATMHSMSMHGSMMEMRPLQSVAIPAHGQVRFEPEHMHVMLPELVHPLRVGDRFALTLIFRRAGRITTQVQVGGFGAEGPVTHAGDHAP